MPSSKRIRRPIPGQWTDIPIDPLIGTCAQEMCTHMSADEWASLKSGVKDVHATLISRSAFSDIVKQQAILEIQKVVLYGWPAYVDGEIARHSREKRRDFCVSLATIFNISFLFFLFSVMF